MGTVPDSTIARFTDLSAAALLVKVSQTNTSRNTTSVRAVEAVMMDTISISGLDMYLTAATRVHKLLLTEFKHTYHHDEWSVRSISQFCHQCHPRPRPPSVLSFASLGRVPFVVFFPFPYSFILVLIHKCAPQRASAFKHRHRS